MRTIFTLLLLFSVAFGFSTAQNIVIEVAKTGTPITIDGLEDDAWSTVTPIEITEWGEGNPVPDPLDFSSQFRMLWDDDYLYFFCEVEDDILREMADLTGVQDWEVDNIEFYWSPGNSHLADATEMIQVRFAYANASNDNPTPGTKNGWSPGGFTLADFVNAQIDKGPADYRIEFAVNLAVSATAAGLDEIALGDTVGTNIIACDNDEGTTRENIGTSILDFQWDQADTMIRAVLVEGPSVTENLPRETWRIYPNPATDVISVSNAQQLTLFEIYNLQGQVLLSTEDISDQISIAHLKRGVYYIRMRGKDNSSTIKEFIKY